MTSQTIRVTQVSAGGALAMVAAVGAGALVAVLPMAAAGALILGAVGALVWARPYVAAYLIIGITPLVAGIDRGAVFPLLRPNEVLAVFLAAVLTSRGLIRWPASRAFRISLHPVEKAFVALAITSSIVPVVWLLARGRDLTGDDVSYALVLWKFLGVYALVRVTVKTQEHIHRCLQISVFAAAVVAMIGILQVMGVIGVDTWPMNLYVPEGHAADLAGGPRASSTLTLPAATADLLIFNLVIALGMYFRRGRDYGWYAAAAALFVVGVFATGEFSSALGLVIAVVAAALALRKVRLLMAMPVVATFGILAMWPVVSTRLEGFASVNGLPASWIGRLHNLETYFWPELWSGPNLLLGVRPSARIPVSDEITGFVWIESGYTWLLWGGGIPLLLAFIYFSAVTFQLTQTQQRIGPAYTQVAAFSTFVALTVVVGLMVFDPHLTYRGSADCFFALLALTVVGRSRGDPPEFDPDAGDTARNSDRASQGRKSNADSIEADWAAAYTRAAHSRGHVTGGGGGDRRRVDPTVAVRVGRPRGGPGRANQGRDSAGA
jgi:hypothetical protein